MTMKKVYLTLAAIVRDQEHYVREWLAFHRLVGVERFVIVLHRCKDRTEEMIRSLPFADSIFVHHVADDRQHVQLGVYRWIHESYGGATRWILDLRTGKFARGCLRRRPGIDIEIFKVNQSYWRYFKPHYYLDLPFPPAAECFVGTADGELAFHLVVCPFFTAKAYRATRLVVMPEWQGAGVGVRLLEWVCQYHLDGNGRCGYKLPTFFHMSHPQLCAALRRRACWINTKRSLYGDDKTRSIASLKKSGAKVTCGYGGHFRAVQAFKYVGVQEE